MRSTWWLLAVAVLGFDTAAAVPTWQALPAAPTDIRLDDLHFVSADTGWVCTAHGKIYATTDGGASWAMQKDDPTLYFRTIRFADARHGFAGTLSTSALLFETSNGGATWSQVFGIPSPQPNAICGLSVPSRSVIYGVGSYSGPARMIKSTDGGATWTSKDLDPLATTLVDVHFRSETEGFAVGSIGTFYAQSQAVVLHTEDGGFSWEQFYVGSRLGEWGWKISFPTPLVGYVSLERFEGPMYFLKTTDGGTTWVEYPFPDYNEQGIGFVTPDVGWVGGADNPTFGTTDGGATWSETPWGHYINRLQFLNPSLGYATGVTVYKYSETTVAVDGASRPKRASLAAPNPFVSNTTIRFALTRGGPVHLFVADPAGRIVRTLETGHRSKGSHVVTWDGKTDRGDAAPAGIYLYVLHAGERHEMGKLVRVP
jgi:photosystem II stability/assembly factor-like uncharacterized protein